MVVSAEVFQIQDVSEEQILDRCNLGQEIQTQQSLKSSWWDHVKICGTC